MKIGEESLLHLITRPPHVVSHVEVVVVGPGTLAAVRSFEEALQAQEWPARSATRIVVVINRRGFVPRNLFGLSLILRSPEWLADRLAAVTGMVAAEHYLLWPTPETPGYAFEGRDARVGIKWARRVGAIGRSSRGRFSSLARVSPVYQEFVRRTGAVAIYLVQASGPEDAAS